MNGSVRQRIILGGLLGGAATAAGIALTATSGWLIVRAAEHPVLLTLFVAIVGVRTFGMARPFFRYLERVVSHDAALEDLAERRTSVYAALVPLTPARLGRRSRATVLTAVVDDLTDAVESQVRVTVPVLSSIVAGALAVVLTALIAPISGLILAGLLLAIAAACLLAWKLESAALAEVLDARAEVLRVSDLVARQASELQAIGAETTALRWLDQAHDTLAAAVRRQSRGRALVSAVTLVATGVATGASAMLAQPEVIGGPLAALLVVVPVAVGDAMAPLVDAMRALARARGSEARLAALLAQGPAVQDSADPANTLAEGGPELSLEAVSATWTGERSDLPPTTATIPMGHRLAVVGANGSGKSTLLAVLARHLDPASGRYAVSGTDVRTLALDEVRDRIALVDDEPHIFASGLRENLILAAPDTSDEELIGALRRAGLGEWFNNLENGLDTRIGHGGRGLSGGERARVGVARAIASHRSVLMLDEPVAHLDHATAVSVIHDLLEASQGRSVVMVSHRPEGLDEFDEVRDFTSNAAATGGS